MWIIIVIVFFIALFYESLNTPSQDKKKKLPYDSQSVYRPGEHLAQLEAEKRQRNNMPIDRQATKVSHIPQAPTLKFTWDKGFRSKEDEIDADVIPVFDLTNLDKGTRYQFRTAPNSPQVKIAYSHLSERCILGFLTDSLMSTDALRIGLKYVDWCTSTSEPVFVVAWVKNGQGVLKPGHYVRVGEHIHAIDDAHSPSSQMEPAMPAQTPEVSTSAQAFTWAKGFRSKEKEIAAHVMPVYDLTTLDEGTRYQYRAAPNSPRVRVAYSDFSERCITGNLSKTLLSTDALRMGLVYRHWSPRYSEPVFEVAWVKNGQGLLYPGLYVRVAEHIHAIVDEHSPTFQTRPPQPNIYQSSVGNTTTVPPRQEESYGEKSEKTTKPGQSQRVSIPLRKWEPPIELLGLPRKLAHLVEKQPPVSNQQQKQPAVSTQQKGEDNYRSLYFGD